MGENTIDIKALVSKAISRWYLFVLSMIIAGGLAYLYLKRATPIFASRALILIKDDEKSGSLTQEAIFEELGGPFVKSKNLENEMLVLRSTPLFAKVVSQLNLQNEYYSVGRFRKQILYGNAPIEILNWQPIDTSLYFEATITNVNAGEFTLIHEEDDVENQYKGEFGKILSIPQGRLTLNLVRDREITEDLEIRIWPVEARAEAFAESFGVVLEVDKSSVLNLSIEDESPVRATDILATLIKVYNEGSVDDKNKIYRNSINLINERINDIAGQLAAAEGRVESFRSQTGAIELTAESSLLMTKLSEVEKGIASTEVQLSILNDIETELVSNKNNFQFIPTDSRIDNITLINQLESFNEGIKERSRLRTDLGPAHPDLKLAERRINNLRETIIENIRAIKSNVQLTRGSNEEQKTQVESRIQTLPRVQRQLLAMERQSGIKEELYLFLLQKREESTISLAVTVENGKVVEPPRAYPTPVSPDRRIAILSAGFLGLLIPAAFIYATLFLSDKVQNESDIERQLINTAIVGTIPLDKSKAPVVVKENSRTVSAERFRLLRANLSYILPGEDLKTVLVTSSIPGEGKSYVALNLAMVQALSQKKTVILELDLRKPKLTPNAVDQNNSADNPGIVNYIINNTVSLDDIIQKSTLHPNLDVLSSGPQPPNPGELMLSPRLGEMINQLKDRYDFIIIDTPPVGIVSDPLYLKDLVDATLYLVRAGVTPKSQLKEVKELFEAKKLPHMFIVLNGLKVAKSGYNYGYTSDSYFEQEKPSLLKRIFRR